MFEKYLNPIVMKIRLRVVDFNTVDLFRLSFFYLVWYYIKLPINNVIYGKVQAFVCAFFLAFIVSFIISKLMNKIFDHFFNKLDLPLLLYLPIYVVLDLGIFEVLSLHVLKMYSSTLSTMPSVSPRMYGFSIKYRQELEKAKLQVRSARSILEPLTTAINRDRSHPTHPSLADAFLEHKGVSNKVENMLNKEIWDCHIAVNNNEATFQLERPNREEFIEIKQEAKLAVNNKIFALIESLSQ
jgi:hypothetical protein